MWKKKKRKYLIISGQTNFIYETCDEIQCSQCLNRHKTKTCTNKYPRFHNLIYFIQYCLTFSRKERLVSWNETFEVQLNYTSYNCFYLFKISASIFKCTFSTRHYSTHKYFYTILCITPKFRPTYLSSGFLLLVQIATVFSRGIIQ